MGLDNAGKTTLLHLLKEDIYIETDSTINPHSEELVIGDISFNTFDLGGHEIARKIWKNYIFNMDGIIFLIDTTDRERLELVKEEIDKLLENPDLFDTPICILANKIDLPGSTSEEELREYLGLLPHQTYGKDSKSQHAENRKIEIFMCSVKAKMGFSDGFQWISSFLD